MKLSQYIRASLVLTTYMLNLGLVSAHGIAGDRYFPPTISVEDPFAANEVHSNFGRTPNVGVNNVTTTSGNIVKVGAGFEPLDGLGISFDGIYRQPNGNLDPLANGFDNIYFTLKKELAINAQHEFAITIGVNGQIKNSGSKGGDTYSTYAPSIFYAKGFGDLPSELAILKPFAISGVLGYSIPTSAAESKALNLGFTLQYSFMYLNKHVQQTGWPNFLNQMIAVVEFPLQRCLNGSCNGQMIGSINPGMVWVGKDFNLSAEAVFPINQQSGSGVGALFQIHKYFGN